jgi:hypothetical protein
MVTARRPCPPAPGPLEGYAARFDDLLGSLAQRRGFREYLTGLLLPRDRNKTLTCPAGAEPVAGAQHPAVQRLRFFLSASTWDHELVNARRLQLLRADPATAPHADGVLVIDDSGDRKDGQATAPVGKQWLGRYGKSECGVVTVTTLWADERVHHPLHAVPYTPAHHFPGGRSDPGFRTKLQIGAALARRAQAAEVNFRAVVADAAYGDQDGFRGELSTAGLPFVMALKRRRGLWAHADEARTPSTPHANSPGAARGDPAPGRRSPAPSGTGTPPGGGPPTPNRAGGDRTAPPAWWSPPPTRRPCRRRTPGTSPPTCPHPADPARRAAPIRPPTWHRWCGSMASGTGPSRATGRSRTSSAGPTSKSAPIPRSAATRPWSTARSPSAGPPGGPRPDSRPPRRGRPDVKRGERGGPEPPSPPPSVVPAEGGPRGPRPAGPRDRVAALVARMVEGAPTRRTARPDQRGHRRTDPAPLLPGSTNHR